MNERRRADDNICSRFWRIITPWPQIISFIAAAVYFAAVYQTRFEANAAQLDDHENRIRAVEKTNDRMDAKIDAMMNYWRIPKPRNP